jgi:hypothetical protein
MSIIQGFLLLSPKPTEKINNRESSQVSRVPSCIGTHSEGGVVCPSIAPWTSRVAHWNHDFFGRGGGQEISAGQCALSKVDGGTMRLRPAGESTPAQAGLAQALRVESIVLALKSRLEQPQALKFHSPAYLTNNILEPINFQQSQTCHLLHPQDHTPHRF